MESKNWLIISLCDERWDFNFCMRTFKGTLQELADEEMIDIKDIKEYRDNWLEYHSVERSDRCPTGLTLDEWNKVKDKLELVSFETHLIAPLDNINFNDLCLTDGIVNRNVKFGFIDTKR